MECTNSRFSLLQRGLIRENSGGSVVKNPLANAGDIGDLDLIPGSGRFPWRRKQQPTLVFLPGEFLGQRSLMGYSPWGHKDSDMTEKL